MLLVIIDYLVRIVRAMLEQNDRENNWTLKVVLLMHEFYAGQLDATWDKKVSLPKVQIRRTVYDFCSRF